MIKFEQQRLSPFLSRSPRFQEFRSSRRIIFTFLLLSSAMFPPQFQTRGGGSMVGSTPNLGSFQQAQQSHSRLGGSTNSLTQQIGSQQMLTGSHPHHDAGAQVTVGSGTHQQMMMASGSGFGFLKTPSQHSTQIYCDDVIILFMFICERFLLACHSFHAQ